MVKAEIITIGDEILIGQIVDTNSAWMAERLNNAGISVYQITSVSDTESHIINALNEAGQRADIVLITGGLGPTSDDITKETLASYFKTDMVLNKEILEHITKLLTSKGVSINKLNHDQAILPERCKCIPNNFGTAAGMWFEENNTIYISMPGVPYEMKAMMSDYILPELLERFVKEHIVHKTLMILNHAESALAEKISDWENNLPKGLKLAYLPSPGKIRLRLSMTGQDEDQINSLIDKEINKLQLIIPDDIVSFNAEPIEAVIGRLLIESGRTISVAESCTGGTIAQKITSVAGSSEYFSGGVIAYSNSIKENILGVRNSDILKYGAVSEQVVIQMAKGVQKLMSTDCAIATSGIAGPGGGTDEKPVGTVWIAVAYSNKIITAKYRFRDQRDRNIEKSSIQALEMLRKVILNKE